MSTLTATPLPRTTAAGIPVPDLLDADRKALLIEAGLESGTRLVAINGQPVPDLEGLAGMIEAAMTNLTDNEGFTLELNINIGSFESAVLIAKHAHH